MIPKLIFVLLISAESTSYLCSSCVASTNSLQTWLNDQKNAYRISNFTSYVCTQSWAPSNCQVLLSNLLPELNQALQQGYINPSRLCYLMQACTTPSYKHENFTAWEQSIMKGAPAYSAPSLGQDYMKFGHITDVNLDNDYVQGSASACSSPPCCRGTAAVTTAAGKWGDYNCDIPLVTVNATINYLALQNLDFIIWTGNTPAHNLYLSKDQKLASIKTLTNVLKAKLSTSVLVYPIFGNNDCYIEYQCSFASNNWLYTGVASLWSSWIGSAAAASLKSYGRYSVMHRNTNLKIVAINTLACDVNNLWLFGNSTDPGGNLGFLKTELASAEANNQLVYIIGHIPPASEACMDLWSNHYGVLVKRYSNTIRGQFFGNLGTDELRIYRDDENNPINVQFIAPPLDSLNYRNPSFRIYTSDLLSKSVTTYSQYRMDLTSASPSFVQAYEFLSYYLVKDMFPATIDSLAATMHSRTLVMMKYLSNKFTNSPAAPVDCDSQCITDNYCDISNYTPETIRACKGLSRSPYQFLLQTLYGGWVYQA